MRNMICRVAAGITGFLLASAMPAIAAGTSAAGTTDSAVAATPGWRVIKVFSQAESSGIPAVATSGSDAWTIWWNQAATGQAAFAERWNGSAWQRVAVPNGLIDDVIDTLSIGASTAGNVWLLWGSIPDGTGAIRWNGSVWRTVNLPGYAIRVSPDPAGDPNAQSVVFGPNDVWVFSVGAAKSGTGPDHLAARFNGHKWIRVTLPATPVWINALAGNDIWGMGPAAGGRHSEVLMHFNGTRWTVTPPVPTVKLASGAFRFFENLTATGPRNAWLEEGAILRSGNTESLSLLHWNGAGWAKVKFGVSVSQADDMAQDGHGGLWLIDQGPRPAQHWFIDHLNGGHWTRYGVPAVPGMTLQDLSGVTSIPGTRSMWVTGDLSKGHASSGLVLKFGP